MSTIDIRIEHLALPRRRLVVAAGFAGYPLAVIVLGAMKHLGVNRWLILGCVTVVIALTLTALVVSYRYARGRIDARRAHLDERDRQLAQRAHAAAYRLLATVLVLGVAAVEIALTTGHRLSLDESGFGPVVMWVIVYIPVLPTLMLAWIEPTPPADA